VAIASGLVLVVLLAFACLSDLQTRRIPNRLVLLTAVLGILIALVTKPWVSGLRQAAGGLAAGFAIWVPFYLFKMLGAGDVKLFAAASTFLGPWLAVEGSLYTALYGGLIALTFMIMKSGWLATALRLSHAAHQPGLLRNEPTARWRIPYAFAIAGGVLTAFWWPGHLIQ